MTSPEILKLFERYVIPNYGRFPVALVRGEDSWVWDAEGNRYLDLFPGWGCNLLGHCPAPVVEAVREQLGQLIHVPNTWHTELQGLWAKALSERSFGGQAFFCNSGTEANEAAIKLVRLHSTPKRRYKIITFEGGFHGRTLGSTTATAQPKYHAGLGPLMAGFTYAPFGDLEATAALSRRRDGGHHDRADPGGGRRADPARRFPGRPAATGRPARTAAGVRRGADGLRADGRLVRLPGRRRHARHHDPGQMRLRGPGGGGHAGQGGNCPQPAARHARRHLRRQSHRRPRRPGRHRHDRGAEPAGGRQAAGRSLPGPLRAAPPGVRPGARCPRPRRA